MRIGKRRESQPRSLPREIRPSDIGRGAGSKGVGRLAVLQSFLLLYVRRARALGCRRVHINNLVQEIHAERAKRAETWTVNRALASFEDAMQEIVRVGWTIANDEMAQRRDRAAALREICEAYSVYSRSSSTPASSSASSARWTWRSVTRRSRRSASKPSVRHSKAGDSSLLERRMDQPKNPQLLDYAFGTLEGRRESAHSLLGFFVSLSHRLRHRPARHIPPEHVHSLESNNDRHLPIIGAMTRSGSPTRLTRANDTITCTQ